MIKEVLESSQSHGKDMINQTSNSQLGYQKQEKDPQSVSRQHPYQNMPTALYDIATQDGEQRAQQEEEPVQPAAHAKPSILTQETDLQISTHNASSIEQRAIFDQSPKLMQVDTSPQHGTALKAPRNHEKDDVTIMTELGQPELSQTKKIVSLETATAVRAASSAKPLNNAATTTTAF